MTNWRTEDRRESGVRSARAVAEGCAALQRDGLAFGHVVIAIAFVGAWREPIRNQWLYRFGMIACVAVIPWALVFGALRGIPLWWRAIDCSFGIVGYFPCRWCERAVQRLGGTTGRGQADAP